MLCLFMTINVKALTFLWQASQSIPLKMTEYHKVSVFLLLLFFFASAIFNHSGYDALKQQEERHKEPVRVFAECSMLQRTLLFTFFYCHIECRRKSWMQKCTKSNGQKPHPKTDPLAVKKRGVQTNKIMKKYTFSSKNAKIKNNVIKLN